MNNFLRIALLLSVALLAGCLKSVGTKVEDEKTYDHAHFGMVLLCKKSQAAYTKQLPPDHPDYADYRFRLTKQCQEILNP